MKVEDVFYIQWRGIVATGRVQYGTLRVGDEVRINDGRSVRVDGIEASRRVQHTATVGDNVGLLFRSLTEHDVAAGDLLESTGDC